MFAPEGLWFLVIPAILFFLLAAGAVVWKKPWMFVVSGVVMLFWIAMLIFFRDPVRVLPPQDAIVSPTDGTVVEVETDSTGSVRVAIFLALYNVHAVRAPIEATVLSNEFVPGRFFRADNPEAGRRNQHVLLDLKTKYGLVKMKVISGAIARRVIVPLAVGEHIFPGHRIGFVRFGSRCEITYPAGFVPDVKIGDKVYGGITLR